MGLSLSPNSPLLNLLFISVFIFFPEIFIELDYVSSDTMNAVYKEAVHREQFLSSGIVRDQEVSYKYEL